MTSLNILSIAGSDSGGGAGIQGDLKTISALKGYGLSVITAITSQNTQRVEGVYPLSAQIVKEQLECVFKDIQVDAIKIGMLFNQEIMCAVNEFFHDLRNKINIPIVIDPVMISKSRDRLMRDNDIDYYIKNILPLATCITPNLPEWEIILQQFKSEDEDDVIARFLDRKISLIVKGGHSLDTNLLKYQSNDQYEIINYLYFHDLGRKKEIQIKTKRFNTKNTHGTGCTFSSALATFLAQGFSVYESSLKATEYVASCIQYASELNVGKGHGPVAHFFERSGNGGKKDE